MEIDKLNVGIAGFGCIGTVHAQIFDTMAAVDVIQVADPNRLYQERFAALTKKKSFHDHYSALNGCDCVVIALPTGLHESAVSHFAEAKVPMLIEKPLGLTYGEAERMMAVLKRERVPAMCGLTGLYHPEFVAMYRQLPAIGDLVSVTERLHQAHPLLRRTLSEAQGVLAVNGIHTLHRFHKIASQQASDPVFSVDEVTLGHDAFSEHGEDHAKGTLHLGGTPFTFDVSFHNRTECDNGWPIDYGIDIVGTRGKIVVTGHYKCETLLDGVPAEVNYAHPDGPLERQRTYPRTLIGITAELEAFLEFLGTGEEQHFTLHEALAGQALVEACYAKAGSDNSLEGDTPTEPANR